MDRSSLATLPVGSRICQNALHGLKHHFELLSSRPGETAVEGMTIALNVVNAQGSALDPASNFDQQKAIARGNGVRTYMSKDHVLGPESGHLRLSGSEPTIKVIANFAWQHMKAASIFRDHLVALEAKHAGQSFGGFFEEIRSYGSACIMSAAASLEALINELFIAHNSPLHAQLPDFESKFWGKGGIERRKILKKYQLALQMLGKPLLNEYALPYRDAWALIELRNALVHYKPVWDPERKRHIELVQVLKGKFALSPFLGAGAGFVSEKCMSAGCARWAVATSLALINEFDSRTNLDKDKMAAFKKLKS